MQVRPANQNRPIDMDADDPETDVGHLPTVPEGDEEGLDDDDDDHTVIR